MPQEPKGSRRNSGPLYVVGAGLLLTAAAAALALQPGSGPEATPTSAPLSPGDVTRVTLAEAKAAYDNDTAVFLDVRFSDDFAVGHIPGAVSIPLNELEGRLGGLDPRDRIVPPCPL